MYLRVRLEGVCVCVEQARRAVDIQIYGTFRRGYVIYSRGS